MAQKPEIGIGQRRVYLTPKGLLSPDEIPYGWELWEVHGKNKPILKVIKGLVLKKIKHEKWGWSAHEETFQNCDRKEYLHFKNQPHSYRTEAMWALKILKRMQQCGHEIEKFADARHLKETLNGGSQ